MKPIQPLFRDPHGQWRFRENKIVTHLLDWASARGMDMNALARLDFTDEDREQFAQLIGYSLNGFADLSYVSDEAYDAASASLPPAPAAPT